MTRASRVLAVWLTPVAVLALPTALAARGPAGLWQGLALAFAPLIILGLASTRSETISNASRGDGEPLFAVVTLLITVGMLLWANMELAGNAAAWLGARRWQGIAFSAVMGWVLTAWRPLHRSAPGLLVVAALAALVPLAQLVWATGLGPLAAWDRVATQPAFRFPPGSPWVTVGRSLALARDGKPLVFEEVHRVSAPVGGVLRARTLDGTRLADVQWVLAPGQTVTLRAGDELVRGTPLRLRFEADRRVPGAPPSGMSWAEGRPRRLAERVGLLVTLLAGGAALLRSGLTARLSRRGVAIVAGGVLFVLFWAQGWAIYAMLQSPDVFLGGVTPERFLELPGVALFADPLRRGLQALLLVAGLAAFLASTVALRERLGAMDRTGGGEIGHDPGLWAGLFGGAALASLWPVDPWALTVLALGGAGSSLGPAALCSPPPGRALATTAGAVGLVVFATVAAAQLGGASGELWGAVVAYPALAGAPAGLLVLWLGRR